MIYYLTGEVILWPTRRLPDGFLQCDGQLVSREQYPALFDHLGYAYGGSGEQFALPNITAPPALNNAPDPDQSPLMQVIATAGLHGPGECFSNAGGVVADIRFLSGGPSAMSGAYPADGRAISIGDNQDLFRLLGTTYGGDGGQTFAVPEVPSLAATNGPTVPSYIVSSGYFPERFGTPLGESYVSELRLSAAGYSPGGWSPAARETQLLINQFMRVFQLIGTLYGGNGRTTFELPIMSNVAGVPFYFAIDGIIPSRG